jgi:four helix bundle protein
MKNFKELIIWQKGIEIVKKVYHLSKQFPAQEKFGITSQMTRAAVSISANIAEGSSRDSDKDYARFLQLALGSAFELQTYLVIVKEMQWVSIDEIIQVELILEEEIKMIHSFIKKLKANS